MAVVCRCAAVIQRCKMCATTRRCDGRQAGPEVERQRGINNFRQLLQHAVSMNEADFKREFGGSGPLTPRLRFLGSPQHMEPGSTRENWPENSSKTDKWVAWADTHALPAESLSQREGWPDGMLGEIRVAKLESQNITKTSQLLDAALSMSQSEFVDHFGKGGALDNRDAAFYTPLPSKPLVSSDYRVFRQHGGIGVRAPADRIIVRSLGSVRMHQLDDG
jgi:hypothetical protein